MLNFVRRIKRWQRAKETARLRESHLGAHSVIHPTAQVLGWKNVQIGERTIISEHCWLNVNDRESGETAISIGSHCFFGRRNFLSSGSRIVIGDYCLTGVDCHFLGSDHVMDDPFRPYLTTGTTGGGEIIVGPNCWFGASIEVLKGTTIGYGCIIGAGAVVRGQIPPLSVVVGNPGRIIKRYDVRTKQWVAIADFSSAAEKEYPSEAEYLARLRQAAPTFRGPLVASGSDFGDL